MSIAALYPGQGSQHVGMGKFLHQEFASVKQLFEEASDALGIDMKKLLFNSSEADLALTENTQPAILLTSVSTYTAIKENFDFQPVATAGHSIGEYASFVTSGALDFATALKLVRQRGQLMQQAVPKGVGGMVAALGFSPLQVETICSLARSNTSGQVLEAANYNAPGQIVLSGHQASIDWLIENYNVEIFASLPESEQKVKRGKFIPLKVSAPFHCSLMMPAEEGMRPLIEGAEMSAPTFPIIQNYTAETSTDIDTLKEGLISQISSSVRWVECVEGLKSYNVKMALELGAGTVLKGLVKKINPDIRVFNVNSVDDLKDLDSVIS